MLKKPRNSSNWGVYIIIILSSVIFGFLLYHFTLSWWQISLSPEISLQIDPLNFVSTIVTVILAVMVLRKLDRKDGNAKIERDLMIKQFADFDTSFIERMKILAKNGVKYSHVAASIKRYHMRIKKNIDLAKELELLTESTLPSDLLKRMQDLNKLMTDTPKQGDVEDGIRINSGLLSFSETQLDKISEAITDISCLIFKISVEINRS